MLVHRDLARWSQGNVAFACAGDGWAFTVGQMAEMYATKMGANPVALHKVRRSNSTAHHIELGRGCVATCYAKRAPARTFTAAGLRLRFYSDAGRP